MAGAWRSKGREPRRTCGPAERTLQAGLALLTANQDPAEMLPPAPSAAADKFPLRRLGGGGATNAPQRWAVMRSQGPHLTAFSLSLHPPGRGHRGRVSPPKSCPQALPLPLLSLFSEGRGSELSGLWHANPAQAPQPQRAHTHTGL